MLAEKVGCSSSELIELLCPPPLSSRRASAGHHAHLCEGRPLLRAGGPAALHERRHRRHGLAGVHGGAEPVARVQEAQRDLPDDRLLPPPDLHLIYT